MTRTSHSLLSSYLDQGDRIDAPDGACLFRPGDESRAFLIVSSGTVRVEQTNSAGRTIVLYRVDTGESCVLTTTCLLSDRPYSGFGYAEGDVSAVSISADRFKTLLSNDPGFRDLVFSSFARRIGDLTDVIDALLLHRTDIRLAHWLGSKGAIEVRQTQQTIAHELGTAREVISRALKSFEENGWIRLGRGTVTVINPAALLGHGTDVAL